jgi:WD40 repeat protein
LCLTGGSDSKLKLWDLRQRRCIRDYGGNDVYDTADIDYKEFHKDSIWKIEPSENFDTCFTGGRDG